MNNQLKLSILDLAMIKKGKTASETLKDSTEIAQLADQLGYNRYWFAEHHNMKHQISTSPDLLAAHVGALTKHIRVGTGGIMLPNYSALKVAENFATLEALHPGRVDLGIGRAPGTDPITAMALRQSEGLAYQFPQQMEDLLGYLKHDLPISHPYQKITASPDSRLIPEIFLLGSSQGGSAHLAAKQGLGFVFASQINPVLTVPVLRAYRENFKPSSFLSEPKSMVSIIVIVAETDEEAHYLAAPSILQWVRIATGQIGKVLSLEEANAYVYSPQEEMIKRMNENRFVIGSIEKVAEQLNGLASDALVDEIIIFDAYPNQESRMKAYQLLARKFNLKSN
jgi:luciferase family oxidoreductase group 1